MTLYDPLFATKNVKEEGERSSKKLSVVCTFNGGHTIISFITVHVLWRFYSAVLV